MNIRYDIFDNVVYTDLNEKEYKGMVLKSNSFYTWMEFYSEDNLSKWIKQKIKTILWYNPYIHKIQKANVFKVPTQLLKWVPSNKSDAASFEKIFGFKYPVC